MIIHDVEQRSPEWFALRLGVPTASDFHKAITPKKGQLSAQGPAYASALALELYNNAPCEGFAGSEWMDRGADLEDDAADMYELINSVDTQKVGFITDDKGRGCSPDRLVGDDGSIEIKCLKPENHVAAMVEWVDHDTFDAKYIPQTQGQLLISQRKWCDLVFYCPGLPLVTVRIEPDKTYSESLDKALGQIIETRDRALSLLRGEETERKAA